MIDRYVTGKLLRVLPRVKLPSVYVEPVQSLEDSETVAARVTVPELPVEERRGSYAEVELSICEQAALCEARRCLRCDLEFTEPQ